MVGCLSFVANRSVKVDPPNALIQPWRERRIIEDDPGRFEVPVLTLLELFHLASQPRDVPADLGREPQCRLEVAGEHRFCPSRDGQPPALIVTKTRCVDDFLDHRGGKVRVQQIDGAGAEQRGIHRDRIKVGRQLASEAVRPRKRKGLERCPTEVVRPGRGNSGRREANAIDRRPAETLADRLLFDRDLLRGGPDS